MKKLTEERKDIAVYIMLFPLPSHKDAYEKSKAIECKKSLALLEDAFQRKPVPAPSCETSAIDDNLKLGRELGVNATPTIIFPDGRVHAGYMSAANIIGELAK